MAPCIAANHLEQKQNTEASTESRRHFNGFLADRTNIPILVNYFNGLVDYKAAILYLTNWDESSLRVKLDMNFHVNPGTSRNASVRVVTGTELLEMATEHRALNVAGDDPSIDDPTSDQFFDESRKIAATMTKLGGILDRSGELALAQVIAEHAELNGKDGLDTSDPLVKALVMRLVNNVIDDAASAQVDAIERAAPSIYEEGGFIEL